MEELLSPQSFVILAVTPGSAECRQSGHTGLQGQRGMDGTATAHCAPGCGTAEGLHHQARGHRREGRQGLSHSTAPNAFVQVYYLTLPTALTTETKPILSVRSNFC